MIKKLNVDEMKKEKLSNKYDANFTAGGLLHHEFLSLRKVLEGNDIEKDLKEEESQNRYIGVNTIAARKRILSEIKRRAAHAPEGFWDQFYQWNEKEQKLALLYICLRTYKLVFDIHWEVALKKFRTGGTLDAYHISLFLDELASKDENVASWSHLTTEKINVQYRKAMKDAGLLSKNTLHKQLGIPESFWTFFNRINETWWMEACFMPLMKS